ncbi:MAG: hypothetical protein ACFB9M_00120 [Myxococcota bacterium]
MAHYFTLVASLPALPYFAQAKRVPINRERLDERLGMLNPSDLEEARRAEDFLTWQRQPEHRTDTEVMEAYDRVLRGARSVTLRKMVTDRLRRRTMQVELRRRHVGAQPPEPKDGWGPPGLLFTIRRNWSRPDFGLNAVHPWILPMVEHLKTENAIALERLLMENSWRSLDRLMARERPKFSFDSVLIYLFQWDILSRWVSYDPATAQERFDSLVEEAWDGLAAS